MVSYFTIIITTVVSRYSDDEISKCLMYNARNIFVTKLCRKCSTCTQVKFSDKYTRQ